MTRLALVTLMLLCPLLAHAQERVTVSEVTSETDPLIAELLREALREAVLDAHDLRGSRRAGAAWILRGEIHRAGDYEEDRLHVSLRLVRADDAIDERRVETTMSTDQPVAHVRDRARSFLDALFGTALTYHEARATPTRTRASGTRLEDELSTNPTAWFDAATLGWSAVSAFAASVAVLIGTQVRLTDLRHDPEWTTARDATAHTDDVCASSRSLQSLCAEADALEGATVTALGLGTTSLITAVSAFVFDALDEQQPLVSVQASAESVQVAVQGQF